MTVEAPATPAAGEAIAPEVSDIAVHTPGKDGPLTAREAANSITDWRRKRAAGQPSLDSESPTERNAAVRDAMARGEGSTELAVEANADSPQETTGEDQAAEPELPAIDPPRSWTKDATERWNKLDRETQELLVARDSEDQKAIKRAFNEAAEARKAVDADREAVSQARQQYEAALPALLQTLQQTQSGEFSDIKNYPDVQRLAAEDPLRFSRWQAHQMQVQAIQQELTATQQRQASEFQTQWNTFAQTEDDKFAEKVADIKDPEKAPKIRDKAVGVLKDLGFSDDELGKLWNGQIPFSPRDHRFQLLVHEVAQYREAKAKAKVALTKPVPPVQRPGVAAPKGAAAAENIQALKAKLERTGSAKDAAALIAAQRKAASRG